MNETRVSVEAKGGAQETENERDPLALEGEGEVDPLAVPAVVKIELEPEPEPAQEHDKCIETVDVDKQPLPTPTDEQFVKSAIVNSLAVVNEKEIEPEKRIPKAANYTESTEKVASVNKPLSRKSSTEEVKSHPPEEVVEMNIDAPGVREANTETNCITDKKQKDSKVNGSEKPEDYEKLNGDAKKETTRKRSSEVNTESPTKKLCVEVQKTFPHHDNMINDYIQNTTRNNVDEIQRHTEQLLSEIQTLRELAQKKEHEWNNILHLKKVKEEILLRLLRRKQVLSFEKSPEVNGTDRSEAMDLATHPKNFTIDKSDEISGVAIKQAGSCTLNAAVPAISQYNPLTAPPPYDKGVNSLSKAMFPQGMVIPGPRMPGFDINGQLLANYSMQMGRQGPVKDVKSIIADYRQRHPETVPRRGRRMKSLLNQQMGGNSRPLTPKDSLNNLGMLLNNMDMNQKSMLERLSQVQAGALPNGMSFKDVLIQFANMQQQQQQQNAVGFMATRPQHENFLAGQRQTETKHTQDAVTVTKTDKESTRAQTDSRTNDAHKTSEQTRSILPPPYPEISLHPVVSSSNSGEQQTQNSSLLHGILTKQASSATQTFSPTLAKLLTSPERKQAATSYVQAKSCGEITITPVQPKSKEQPSASSACAPAPAPAPAPVHNNTADTAEPTATEEVLQLEEEEESRGASETSGGEAEGSSGEGGSRLVIDEGAGSEVPVCQGCRRRDAQFVCAGCANQWYCSRDCQVAAWDEHSEMCSG